MATFLGEIGGREIDGDPLGRQREADRGECGAHPFAAFRHRLVGQSHHDEGGKPGRKLNLHLDGARLQPEKRHGRDDRDHATPCFAPASTLTATERLSSDCNR